MTVKTEVALITQVQDLLADNTSGQISEEDVRTCLIDIIESNLNIEDIDAALAVLGLADAPSTQYILIADDAFGEVDVPTTGGYCFVTFNAKSGFPQLPESSAFWYDAGDSLVRAVFDLHSGLGSQATVTTTDTSDINDVTDGEIMVIVKAGKIKIGNRQGSSSTFKVSFL